MHVHKRNSAVSWIKREMEMAKKEKTSSEFFFLSRKQNGSSNQFHLCFSLTLSYVFTNIYDGEVVGRNVYVLYLHVHILCFHAFYRHTHINMYNNAVVWFWWNRLFFLLRSSCPLFAFMHFHMNHSK